MAAKPTTKASAPEVSPDEVALGAKEDTTVEATPDVLTEETADPTAAPTPPKLPTKSEKYFEAIGRRKRATARVRLYTKKASDHIPEDATLMWVNQARHTDFFKDPVLWETVESPLRKLKSTQRFKATVHVTGGGTRGQADAIRHGLSRALTAFDDNDRKRLRRAGFLTRDPRKKERKKPGLKKARRAKQWSKR
jgi:small subunit ribosomal protein S9